MCPSSTGPAARAPIDLGYAYIPIATIVIVGLSNAVNFTDGLDGLAGLISATAFAVYGAIALMQGQFYLARFCFYLVGALFGFLWFNVHPAQLFMGDTGSLSLGRYPGCCGLDDRSVAADPAHRRDPRQRSAERGHPDPLLSS